MNKIIIVQHCQSEHHINDLSGGWTDTPLTELGKEQAAKIGEKLKKSINPYDFVLYSSDLMRAYQTAEVIREYLNLDIVKEKDLREINTGIAAGKTKKWVKENENKTTFDYYDIDHQSFENAETPRQFYKRVHKCMERISSNEEKNLLLVTHGGTVSNILYWWLKFNPEIIRETCFLSSPASITILSKSRFNQNAMSIFNDTSHLKFI